MYTFPSQPGNLINSTPFRNGLFSFPSPNLTRFGILVNETFQGASLPSTFVDVGSASPTFSSGMVLTGSTATVFSTRRVDYNYWHCFEDYVQEMTFTIGAAPGAATYGPSLHIQNDYTTGNRLISLIYYCTSGAAGSIDGKLRLFVGTGDPVTTSFSYTVKETSTASFAPVNGRSYTLKLKVFKVTSGTKYLGTVTDNSNGASLSVSWTEDVSVAAVSIPNYYATNTARSGIAHIGGTYTVKNFKLDVNDLKRQKALLVGDSISHGLNARDITRRFSETAFNQSYQVSAGPGDKTADVLNKINNLIEYDADEYYLFYGTNDVSVAAGTRQNNYALVVNALKRQGKTVKHVLSLPRANNANIVSFNEWKKATYKTDTIIDLYAPFLNAATGNLKTEYDGGDGTHPNQKGHDLIAQMILDQNPRIV